MKNMDLRAARVAAAVWMTFAAGQAGAAEIYFYGSDLARDDTAWDEESRTATLLGDRDIYRYFGYSQRFGTQTHPEGEAQFISLVAYDPYADPRRTDPCIEPLPAPRAARSSPCSAMLSPL